MYLLFNNFQKPSLHCMVIAAKLYTVNIKDPNNAVQDVWERSFKELGDDNPEQITSGMLIFYPHQLVGYLEVCIFLLYY